MQNSQQGGIPDPTPQYVFQALNAVAGGDASADAALKHWETDAAPGFLQLLLAVVERPDSVGEVKSRRPL